MISIQNISFSYGSRRILEDISFDIPDGSCVAVLGNNGAGKSTLIKCLNRINHVKQGSVHINGEDVLKMSRGELAKHIAYVAQKNEFPHTTVYDAILLGRKPYIKWDATKEDRDIVNDVIDRMGLEEYILRYVNELSGGEAQKVMLARAVVQQPQFLLLDEPTSALDPKNQYEMMRMVQQVTKERNISSAIVIHDLNLALRYCDRFLFLKDSHVFAAGGKEVMTPDNIESVYQIKAAVEHHNGVPIVIPCPDEGI